MPDNYSGSGPVGPVGRCVYTSRMDSRPPPSRMQDESEEPVATLVEPSEYARHLNQVTGMTTRHVIFLKRKFVSRSGYELVRHPVTACATVKYFDERPAVTIVSGVLLVGLTAFLLYMLAITWNRLEPGSRAPIGLLGLAGLYGVRRVFGARRHRLVFTLKDKTILNAVAPGRLPGHEGGHGANRGLRPISRDPGELAADPGLTLSRATFAARLARRRWRASPAAPRRPPGRRRRDRRSLAPRPALGPAHGALSVAHRAAPAFRFVACPLAPCGARTLPLHEAAWRSEGWHSAGPR